MAYCRGAYCVLAYEAVDLLHAAGRRARRMHEGMLEWRLGGLPVGAGGAAQQVDRRPLPDQGPCSLDAQQAKV